MRGIKAALCLALTTLIVFSCGGTALTAQADGEVSVAPVYAYAPTENTVYFCADADEDTALFAIPDTYCVQILGESDGWLHVKYAEDEGLYRALYGYCRTDDVILLDEPLENLYLNLTVTVTYRTDAANSLLAALPDIECKAAYYGSYTVGKTVCSYVLCGSDFGYIPGAITEYPLNELPQAAAVSAAAEDDGNTTLVTAVAVTLIAAAAIAILYFTGRRRPDGDGDTAAR